VLLGIAAFILLSGSGASAVRSGIMAFLFLLAVRIGRAKKASTALIFSAAVMVFVNPFVLAGDVSFQLSFLAVFGLVYLVPPLTRWTARWPGGGMKEMLVATFCAQLATLPVIAANFGQFSILSFLANILILPTVPFVMVSGFILVGASFLSPALAAVLSWPAYLILSYYLAVVGWLAGTDIGLIKF
jgi:competence protein ComEC